MATFCKRFSTMLVLNVFLLMASCLMPLPGNPRNGMVCYAEESTDDTVALYYAMYANELLTSQNSSIEHIDAILRYVQAANDVHVSEAENGCIVFGKNISLLQVTNAEMPSCQWLLSLTCDVCDAPLVVSELNPKYTSCSLLAGDIAFEDYYFEGDLDILPDNAFYGVQYCDTAHNCTWDSAITELWKALCAISDIPLGAQYDDVAQKLSHTYQIDERAQTNGDSILVTVFQDANCSLRMRLKFNRHHELYAVQLGMTQPVQNNRLAKPLGIDLPMAVYIDVGIVLSTYLQE